MLPANNGPGRNNSITSQFVSTQLQPTLISQATPQSYIPDHMQSKQIPPTPYNFPNSPQPTTNNSMVLPNYQNQFCTTITTTDEAIDEDITENINSTSWQIARGTKRRKINKATQNNNPSETTVTIHNRYDLLPNEETNEAETQDGNSPKKIPRPPPIFVYDVINYPQMINHLAEVAEEESYSTRSMANNIIKINCNTPETYRKMIRLMKENNIVYHSYQLKDERSYRIVIKHLHHTVELKDIAAELADLGHKVRNIINAKHRQTKEPLNLFFVDLEPAENNKEVYKIRSLQNKIIEIEPPNKSKHMIQCTRCQLYGHSKTYCNRPYLCVKCGGQHNTTTCKKSKDTPATCGLCGGPHPASYKGCEYYRNLTKNRYDNQKTQIPKVNYTSVPDFQPVTTPPNSQPIQPPSFRRTYADAARGRSGDSNNEENINNNNNQDINLSKFLEEFKQMFNQLIQQNSLVLNMLTTLISKLK